MPPRSRPRTSRRVPLLRLAGVALAALAIIAAAADVAGATGSAGGARSVAVSPALAGTRLTPLPASAVARTSSSKGTDLSTSRRGGSAPVAQTASAPQPLGPDQIRTAYALPATGAGHQTIAVIGAFDDPNAEADLSAYDRHYGIRACTSSGGCFKKLNEKGKSTPLPGPDATGGSWITEASISTQIARGVCESCRILLVEANSSSAGDFSAAVDTAAAAGATVIVTTFTNTEDSVFDSLYAPDYVHAHAVVVSAAGDATSGTYGYSGEPYFPSSLPGVLAVGGTSISLGHAGAYAGERAWAGTVSGCSLYQPAPHWQAALAAAVGCQRRRAVADLSAEADPGAVVHITGNGMPGGPWFAATGTSLSAPIIAATVGLAGSLGARETQTLYARAKSDPAAFHDIRSGQNAAGCTTAICRAGKGYDGPTGLGTPFGLAAFLSSGGALDKHHPRVTVTTSGGRLRPNRHWQLTLAAQNGNPFAVSGSVTVRRTLSVGGRTRTVTFATRRLALAPLGKERLTLTISPRYRGLVRQLGSVPVYLRLQLRGPVAPRVTVNRQLELTKP